MELAQISTPIGQIDDRILIVYHQVACTNSLVWAPKMIQHIISQITDVRDELNEEAIRIWLYANVIILIWAPELHPAAHSCMESAHVIERTITYLYNVVRCIVTNVREAECYWTYKLVGSTATPSSYIRGQAIEIYKIQHKEHYNNIYKR